MRAFARLAALLTAVTAASVALAVPVGAHSAAGTLGIEATPGAAPLTATVKVLLEYANDREVAPGAAVVAEASGPGGQTVGTTPLTDVGRGVYEGTLTMPAAGAWTVTVTATNPAATAQATVAVSATATGTTPPATASPGTTATSGDVRTSSDEATNDEADADGDSGGSSTLVIVAIVVVLVGAAAGAAVVVRRRARP